MRFARQSPAIKATNFDEKLVSKKEVRKHATDFHTRYHLWSVELSRISKTNVLISLLESPCGVRFKNVYVYSKSLQQPKYRYLGNILMPIEEIGYFTFSNNCEVIPPSEVLPNFIFIFHDVACDKQDTIREYFAMGRHADVDSSYLCQTYAKIPKHLIRDNANLLILFKQDGTYLKHVYNDRVNTDMS